MSGSFVYVLNTVSEYNCVAFIRELAFFPRLFLKNISKCTRVIIFKFQLIQTRGDMSLELNIA